MAKKILLVILIIAVLGLIVVAGYYFMQTNATVSDSDEEIVFNIQEGEGVKEIGANLELAGLITKTTIFEWYVYFDGSQSKFMAGDYDLMPSQSIKEIVGTLTSGQSIKENQITTLEGWTSQEIDDYLTEEGIISSGDFIAIASTTDASSLVLDKSYSFTNDKPDEMGLEGYLFPDTYRLFIDATATDIVEKMLDNFGVKFTDQMKEDVKAGNMTIYEIITLASIIEKEVAIKLENGQPINNDHYIVAGIFYNRLNNGIGLESDATVNYITKGDRPQPTSEDLEVDNPYNTYKYRGLPPGPIGNPSLEALKAAIYPKKTDYFYFLHKINDDGSTVFSKTFEEHLDNKAKYLD
ncbi:MAG: endolytic transglycosylase MltG [bacterium]|nr:endolytic transglycosylase MltG [bacterium]